MNSLPSLNFQDCVAAYGSFASLNPTIEKAIANPLSVQVETLEWVKQAMGIETQYAIVERREVSLG